jgi:hypothetical protein
MKINVTNKNIAGCSSSALSLAGRDKFLLVAAESRTQRMAAGYLKASICAMPPRKWYVSVYLSVICMPRYAIIILCIGIDTHRMYEVMLLGGIPVVMLNSISSCYDDEDNVITSQDGAVIQRGSLPIVFVKNWEEVTEERLVNEWTRISSVDQRDWDWRRLFVYHWTERIKTVTRRMLRGR